MPNILQIYKDYRIMPKLQAHQLRVAAVAQQICDNFQGQLDKDSIIKTCLLHDMGNILKFDLGYFPDAIQPEGLAYWENVKKELGEQYKTTDEHAVSGEIARELGVSDNVLKYIDSIEFFKISQNMERGSMEQKICAYADLRVKPDNIASVTDRLADGKKRYETREDRDISEANRYDVMLRDALVMERQIFDHCQIKPIDITAESSAGVVEKLKQYEI